MTPKEKAIELVEMFMNIKPIKLSDYSRIYHPTAKQCTLIVVNEILKSTKGMVDEEHGYSSDDYWEEVKKEILEL